MINDEYFQELDNIKNINDNKNQIKLELTIGKVFDLYEHQYIVLNIVDYDKDRFTFKHIICGYEWESSFGNFKNMKKSSCPRCSNKERYTTETYAAKVASVKNGEYELVGEYTGSNNKVTLRHKTCNYILTVRAHSFFCEGRVCTNCSNKASKGEAKIRDFLIRNNITYIKQYSFSDCFYKKILLFDFAIFDIEGKFKMLIEFDGHQHFKPIEWFGGIKSLESQQVKDKIKNEYCKENNIKLLRIPYWEEDNIEKILSAIFSQE